MRIPHCLLLASLACLALAAVPSLRAQEAPAPKPSPSGQPPTQAQVLEEMLKDKAPPLTPAAPAETAREVPPAPPVKLAELLRAPETDLGPVERDGTLVVRARAQLVRVGGEQKIPVLVFHSENRKEPRRPMLVLSSRKLEELEGLQAKAGQDAQFIVSGQVELYRGNNYILLTRVGVMGKDGNLE